VTKRHRWKFGPKGDKPCENFVLFEGMKENNLI